MLENVDKEAERKRVEGRELLQVLNEEEKGRCSFCDRTQTVHQRLLSVQNQMVGLQLLTYLKQRFLWVPCNWPNLHNIQHIRKRESIYCVILCNLRKKNSTTIIVVLCNLQQFSANCYTFCLFGQLHYPRLLQQFRVFRTRKKILRVLLVTFFFRFFSTRYRFSKTSRTILTKLGM